MIAELERLAFAAWPAEEVHDLGGWRVRCTRGVTRRGNSVWTSGGAPRDLTVALSSAAALYAARGLPCQFQLSPLTDPPHLDTWLAERGFAVAAPVRIETADAASIAPMQAAGVRSRVESKLFEAWFDIAGRRSRFRDVSNVYRELLSRIGPGALFALAELDGQPAGTALGVADGRWLGVFSMLTLSECRRRGIGRALLGALAQEARSRGVEQIYLQVERDNLAAVRLYESAGFRTAYGYHYRVSAGQSATPPGAG